MDNLGAQSQNIAYKTFYRSNNAPNNPQIKPMAAPDADYAQNAVVLDTLFCLDNLTPLWSGIAFNWRSSDPDDKELYQIPLQFTHYLVKTPGDTIWAWSDAAWTDTKQIQIFGLETGSYVLSAWTRDDGFTLCNEPATIAFNVIRPTFEYHILMVDKTKNSGFLEVPGDSINAFWISMLQSLQGQLENENYELDGVDVRFLDNSDDIATQNSPISYSLIGQYKLVLIYTEDHAKCAYNYTQNRNAVLEDYLKVGGRVWVEGRAVLFGAFQYPAGNVAISGTSFLGQYVQMATGFASNKLAPSQSTEFKGAIPFLEGLPEIVVDSNHVNLITQGLLPSDNRSLMPEVDWFTRTNLATTLYTFNSITADTIATSPTVVGDTLEVGEGATPVQCTILTDPNKQGLQAVTRVENLTKGVLGQVINFDPVQIFVSYPYGEPWSSNDVVVVDYRYDPISEMHLKPVGIRFENQPRITNTIVIQGITVTYYTYTLGYRTAIFTFPLFFMKNDQGQVQTVVKEMLDWFFYPTIHWTL